MKRILAPLVFLLAACEGEPPKVPEGPAATNAEPAPSASDAGPAPAQETPPVAAAVAPAPTKEQAPLCACADGGSSARAEVGAAEVATAPTEAGAPADQKVTISGAVTTTPHAAAGSVVVYLEDAPIEPGSKMNAVVDNQKMNFYPYVAIVPVGGKVVFHNSDPFPHNVFSPDGEKFNVGNIAQNGGAAARTFKAAGAYTLLCNLHPGMIGYVFVSPSSYYARVDAKGRYAIKNVPPGTYKVSAWAPRLKTNTLAATARGSDITLDFELHR